MLASLGLFVFQLSTLPFETANQEEAWSHPSNERAGTTPAYQFNGKGEETLTLSGVLMPSLTGGPKNLDMISAMADTGQAWVYIEGTGKVMGAYVITALSRSKTAFMDKGESRKIDFTISLTRIDDDRIDRLGDLSNLIGFLT